MSIDETVCWFSVYLTTLKEIWMCANTRHWAAYMKYFIVPKANIFYWSIKDWINKYNVPPHLYKVYSLGLVCIELFILRRRFRDLNRFNHSEFDKLFDRIATEAWFLSGWLSILSIICSFRLRKDFPAEKIWLNLWHTCFLLQQHDLFVSYSWTNFQLASAWVPSRRPALSSFPDSDKDPGDTILEATIWFFLWSNASFARHPRLSSVMGISSLRDTCPRDLAAGRGVFRPLDNAPLAT